MLMHVHMLFVYEHAYVTSMINVLVSVFASVRTGGQASYVGDEYVGRWRGQDMIMNNHGGECVRRRVGVHNY